MTNNGKIRAYRKCTVIYLGTVRTSLRLLFAGPSFSLLGSLLTKSVTNFRTSYKCIQICRATFSMFYNISQPNLAVFPILVNSFQKFHLFIPKTKLSPQRKLPLFNQNLVHSASGQYTTWLCCLTVKKNGLNKMMSFGRKALQCSKTFIILTLIEKR